MAENPAPPQSIEVPAQPPTPEATPQAPIPEPEQAPKKSNRGLIIILVVVGIIILLSLFILIFLVLASRNQPVTMPGPNLVQPQPEPQPTPDNGEEPDQDPDAEEDEVINFVSPEEDSSVSGQFTVEGEATASLQEITVNIYDGNDVLIGTDTAGLASAEDNPLHSWTATIDITRSPGTLTGRIIAFPTSEGESSDLRISMNIRFSEQTSAGRIRLFAPLSNQVTNVSPVMFRGEMKDFFEGTLELRLLTPAGTELFRDFINASGDNYGQFAEFMKAIEFERIPLAAGDEGTWELFETSAADGTETVLLSLPVRFVE